MDPLMLGIGVSMIGANIAMLGLVVRVLLNGKPKKMGNPHPMDPDDIVLGTMSLAAFKKECVKPIVDAIEALK